MDVMGSDLTAGLTAGQIYLGQRAWSLVIEKCVQQAAEVFLISSIFMGKFNGRDWDGTVRVDSKRSASTQLNGMRPRSEDVVECSPMIEDPTKDIEEPALNDKFLDGPDTSVRVRSTIQMSMAAKTKDEGGSGDEDDEDDEDDDNEDDFGEEEGEEGASSEDGGEENNNDPEGGDDEDDEEDEEDGNGNNENNESEDDEDDEDDDEEEVVEEDDDHGEGAEEEDDEGEEDDEKDEDDEDEEALHPPKKRKK